MSCACRESWDLTRKSLWNNIKYYIVKKQWHIIWNHKKLILEDTFLQFVCLIFGHTWYKPEHCESWTCKRCSKFYSSVRWKWRSPIIFGPWKLK